MTKGSAPILELEKVAFRYGDDAPWVFHDVDLTLRQGTIQFLVGPSGAGKTSFIRLASLAVAPNAGRMWLFGEDVQALERERRAELRRRVGVVFQDMRLLDHLTAFDNVALPLKIAKATDRQAETYVGELLGWLGLTEVSDAKPPALSMGQRQLLAVARAIISRPSLLLADEPTSNVDAERANKLMGLFAQMARLGSCVVVATHSREALERHRWAIWAIEEDKLRLARAGETRAKSASELDEGFVAGEAR